LWGRELFAAATVRHDGGDGHMPVVAGGLFEILA
jgi:hypothetical protein